ncbi:hypothetical protein HaLaN_05434 [Haematococcus lacustris]|uniref:Uncharacterized protein n=1 Tax=Haematococcus lacustris TaxID=44745 RepID=A0A699YIX6_HAELA|nr:hypothetical protein HaLaN_05434 [Haematococcus lacustris]
MGHMLWQTTAARSEGIGAAQGVVGSLSGSSVNKAMYSCRGG